MAPKNLPPAAKQAKILEWFRESMGVYTLKELEKLLPAVGAINGMQVKEYLQALQDENQIRVEKIGSGNWYWSFKSDAKKSKENIMSGLRAEEGKLRVSIAEVEQAVEEEMARRTEEDDETLDRKALLATHDALVKEMEGLARDLALYSDDDPTEVLRKVEDTRKYRGAAIRWTDNIEALESFIRTMMPDRATVAEIMQNNCGDEYVMEEGLKEL